MDNLDKIIEESGTPKDFSRAYFKYIANDIGIGPRSWQKPFKALSLTDNQAMITAIGNDYGYEYICDTTYWWQYHRSC